MCGSRQWDVIMLSGKKGSLRESCVKYFRIHILPVILLVLNRLCLHMFGYAHTDLDR